MAIEPVPQEPDMIEIRARRFDLRALLRLTAWGGAAAVALSAVAFVSQTESGSQRLELAFAAAELPVKPVATVKIPPRREQDAEIARLQTQVRTLAADRDRLAERVAGLEHNIEDMTGSIKRQAAQPALAMPPILSMVSGPWSAARCNRRAAGRIAARHDGGQTRAGPATSRGARTGFAAARGRALTAGAHRRRARRRARPAET